MQVTNSRGGRATSAQGRITVCDTDALTFSCLLYPDIGECPDDDVGCRDTSSDVRPGVNDPVDADNPPQRDFCAVGNRLTCASARPGPDAGSMTAGSEALPCLPGPDDCSSEARQVCPGADRSADHLPGPDSLAVLSADITAWHDAEAREVHAPVVFDGSEVLPHVGPNTGSESDAAGESLAHDDSSQAAESDEETEWRILCAVHAFQRRPRYCSLFVARDENIMGVLERAHIILLDP